MTVNHGAPADARATDDARPSTGVREVRERLRRDRERLRAHYAAYGLPQPAILPLHPSYLAVWLHRWSAYNFRRGRPLLARLLWHVNLFVTGADISMISDIGAGLVILHPVSTTVFGRIGRDCTLWGHNSIGGGIRTRTSALGPDCPSSAPASASAPAPPCSGRGGSGTIAFWSPGSS